MPRTLRWQGASRRHCFSRSSSPTRRPGRISTPTPGGMPPSPAGRRAATRSGCERCLLRCRNALTARERRLSDNSGPFGHAPATIPVLASLELTLTRHEWRQAAMSEVSLTGWMKALIAYVRSGEPDLTNRQMALLMLVYLTPGPHTVRGLARVL